MSNQDKKEPRTEVDERMLECFDEVKKNRQYSSYAQLLRELGMRSGNLSEVRSGKVRFKTEYIRNFLMIYPEFDGNWILTGRGEMYVKSSLSGNSELISYLCREIEELKKTNSILLKENGALEWQLKSIKTKSVMPNNVELH